MLVLKKTKGLEIITTAPNNWKNIYINSKSNLNLFHFMVSLLFWSLIR